MNDLKTKPLAKCLEKVIDYRGKTPAKLGGDWAAKGYRALSANNVKTSGLDSVESIRYVDEAIYRKWMKEEVKKGDILLTSEAPAGQVMYWDSDEKIVLSQRLFALRTNGELDSKYLKYYLQSKHGQKEILYKISGSTVTGISAKMFDQIKVNYPSLDIQKQIGQTLYALDKKITINNQTNSAIQEIVKSVYDYWFVQFDFPDKNGKPYKSSGGKMTFNDMLKIPIPKDWNSATMQNLITLQKGVSYTSEEIISQSGLPLINLGSIDITQKYRNEKLKFFSGKVPEVKTVRPRDLLIACTDLTRNADIIGCPIFVPKIYDKYTYSMDLAKINIISTELVNDYYIYMTLRTDWYHSYIKKYATGTNVLHLNTDGVMRYEVPLPPKEIQEKYADLVRPLLSRMDTNLTENIALAKLRDWLLPLLLNGQASFK